MKKSIITLFLLFVYIVVFAQRLSQPLNDHWKFIRKDIGTIANTDNWESVTLPHCWNIVDGQQSGKNRLDENGQAALSDNKVKINDPTPRFGYYRGVGWYARLLPIPIEWKERRVFVRFEAAGQVARVHINGQMLGEHRGAFTAFCFELTNYLQFGRDNELRVEVDNTHRQDIPPLSGDFNVNGGLYRPAELIVTDKLCISPLDFASSGVYISTLSLNDLQARIKVKTILSNGNQMAMSNEMEVLAASFTIETLIKDKAGQVVARQQKDGVLDASRTKEFEQLLTIDKPHRWNGRKDPYLYTVEVRILQHGHVLDQVVQPLGLRTYKITQDQGFVLNDQPYPVNGVGRHQDMKDKAWAMTEDENDRDYSLIKEMGATAIRFAHYPQSKSMHDLADKYGFLVWDEIPLVNEIRLDYEAQHNVRTMLNEMVRQLYNHPSVVWWGIYNEIENIYTPYSAEFLNELKSIIKDFDKERIITAASDHGLRYYNKIADATCFNNYPGWYHGNFPEKEGYTGEFSQFPKFISDRANEVGMRIAISEFGAGGDPAQHAEGHPKKPKPAHGGLFQPEEWLAYVHEEDLRVMKNNRDLWGTFLWAMFDFASCMRNEGSVPSVNTKGIISQDRMIKKDPYFLYKANWNGDPMVYIASRRSVARKHPVTDVKVYSNCQEVVLKVNGKLWGKLKPDNIKVCKFENVQLQHGRNKIEVYGSTTKGNVVDQCSWTLLDD